MRVYVACSAHVRWEAEVDMAFHVVKGAGHELTCDWLSEKKRGIQTPLEAGQMCIQGLDQAEALILDRAGNRCEGSPAYPDCRARNYEAHPVTGSRVRFANERDRWSELKSLDDMCIAIGLELPKGVGSALAASFAYKCAKEALKRKQRQAGVGLTCQVCGRRGCKDCTADTFCNLR